MKYESSILKRLIDVYGVVGNPRYISEIIKQFIVQGKECYPNLFTYQADWLAHIDEFGLTPEYTVSYTGQHIYAPNTKEKPVKSAILKGSTKYRDIDTGEFLETFEEGRNLELVSVKMPVLTTSNEDGTKSNILTVNEGVTLRGIGDVQDTIDCLTGEVVERIDEIVLNGSENWSVNNSNNGGFYSASTSTYIGKPNGVIISDKLPTTTTTKAEGVMMGVSTGKVMVSFNRESSGVTNLNSFVEKLAQNPITILYELATESIKTVGLTIHDKDQQKVEQLTSFDGGTHFTTSTQEGSLLPTLTVDVVTDLEETLNLCSMDGNTL